MNRSQRILVGIGLAALAAMASPYAMRALVDREAVAGKTKVFEVRTARANKDLVLCLIRHPGALNLAVSSNDLYTDPKSGLAVRVVADGAGNVVTGWLPPGRALSPAQRAQVLACT